MPNNLQTLKEIGYNPNNKKLVQMLTKSPKHLKWMTKFFIVPGIFGPSTTYLKKFAQKLMNPAYCVNIEMVEDKKLGNLLAKVKSS